MTGLEMSGMYLMSDGHGAAHAILWAGICVCGLAMSGPADELCASCRRHLCDQIVADALLKVRP